jgi:plastocyanin
VTLSRSKLVLAALAIAAVSGTLGAAIARITSQAGHSISKTATDRPWRASTRPPRNRAPPSAAANPAASNPVGYFAGLALRGDGDFSVPLSKTETLSDEMPAGAVVNRTSRTIRFTTNQPAFVVVASPPNGPDMTFRTAGIVDPTIIVPQGAHVRVEFINGDSDTAHMWLLSAGMLVSAASFPWVAAARPLGDPTSFGQPGEMVSFNANSAGNYTYYCAFPGHATKGMHGRLVLEN